MKSFTFEIKDEQGIHARPAGVLVKEVKKYESKITITKGDKTVEASKLMALMSMGIKKGDTVVVEADGPDEEASIEGMKVFLEANL